MMNTKRLSLTVMCGLAVELANKLAPLLTLHIAGTRLGVERFGYALFGLSLVEMAQPFVAFGYHNRGSLSLSQLPRYGQKARQLLGQVMLLRLIHALIAIAILLQLPSWVPRYERYAAFLTLLAPTLLVCALETIWVHMPYQKMVPIYLANAISRLISLGLIATFIQGPEDALLFAFFSLLPGLLVNLIALVSTLRMLPPAPPKLIHLPQFVHAALPFAGILFWGVIFERSDLLIVEQVLGIQAAGLYAAVSRCGHALYCIALSLITAFQSEMYAADTKTTLSLHLERSLVCLTLLLAPALAGVLFIGDELMMRIFGPDFQNLGRPLAIVFAGTTAAAFLTAIGNQILVVRSRPSAFLGPLVTGGILGAAFAWLGVHKFGIAGAAAGLALGKGISAVFTFKAAAPFVTSFGPKAVLASLSPTVLMVFILLIFKPSTLEGTLAVALATYLLALAAIYPSLIKKLYQLKPATSTG